MKIIRETVYYFLLISVASSFTVTPTFCYRVHFKAFSVILMLCIIIITPRDIIPAAGPKKKLLQKSV